MSNDEGGGVPEANAFHSSSATSDGGVIVDEDVHAAPQSNGAASVAVEPQPAQDILMQENVSDAPISPPEAPAAEVPPPPLSTSSPSVSPPPTPAPSTPPTASSSVSPQAASVPIAAFHVAALEKRRAKRAARIERIFELKFLGRPIRNDDVERHLKCSHRSATTYLEELAIAGRLITEGKGRGKTYRFPD